MIDFTTLWETVSSQLYTLFGLIVVDFLLGVGLAVFRKEFTWEKITDYLINSGGFLVGWLVVEYLTALPQDILPDVVPVISADVVYGTVFLKFFSSILGHLSSMGVLTDTLSKIGVGKKNA